MPRWRSDRCHKRSYFLDPDSAPRTAVPVRIEEATLCPNYGCYYSEPYSRRDWIEGDEYRVAAYHEMLEAVFVVYRGKETPIVVWDNPGFLRLPRRKFYNPSFTSGEREVLFEDDWAIYLADLAPRRVGKLADGKRHVVLSERYLNKTFFVEADE
jgi:hypothetical protein